MRWFRRGFGLLVAAIVLAGATAAQAQIEIYDNIGYSGRRLRLNGAVPNLIAYGFNDRVSSLRVWSGTWQICEHTNFQGRCTTVTGGIPNLVAYGWNDRISSIRPVGRGFGGFGDGNPLDRFFGGRGNDPYRGNDYK